MAAAPTRDRAYTAVPRYGPGGDLVPAGTPGATTQRPGFTRPAVPYSHPNIQPPAGPGTKRPPLSGVRPLQPGPQPGGGVQPVAGTPPGSTTPPVGPGAGLTPPPIQPRPPVTGPPPMAPTPQPGGGGAQPPAPWEGSWQDLRGEMFMPEQSEDVFALRQLLGDKAGGLFDTPDRGELVSEYMDMFNRRNRENLQATTRDIGRDAAKFGRIGSGVTTSRIGDALVESEQRRADAERTLAADAAGKTLSDRLGALSGVSGIQSLLSGQDASHRAEQRGERGYADNLAQQALQNQILQRQMEENFLQMEHQRAMEEARLAGGWGYGIDPTGSLMHGSQTYGQQAQNWWG